MGKFKIEQCTAMKMNEKTLIFLKQEAVVAQ